MVKETCSIDDWISASEGSQFCKFHNIKFSIYARCPKRSHPLISYGEFSKDVESVDKQLISNDKQIIRGTNSISEVPSEIKPRKYVKKVKSIYERFHNYGVKFVAIINWDDVASDIFTINANSKYKRLDFDEAIVKVFKKSILITLRKNQEITNMPVKVAEALCLSIINKIVSKLPDSIKVSVPDVVNTHNAFVNHPFAKSDVKVSVNDELRFISDNSKGSPEFEAINPKFAVSDSEHIEKDIISLIDKGLSREFLASAINSLIEDRKYYADNLKSHVSAINTLGSSVNELKEVVKNISTQQPPNNKPNYLNVVESASSFKSSANYSPKVYIKPEGSSVLTSPLFPPAFTLSREDVESKSKKYRLFRARELLKSNGWGEGVW